MYNTIIEHLISKAIKDFLLEGRNEEKAKQKTYEIIKQHFDNAAWLINVVDNNVLNPNHLTVVEYIESTFRRDYFGTNVSDSVIRLEPIMMNIALQLGFEQNNSDDEKLKRLQDIITYIKNNYKKEGFPIPLNKLTLENSTYDYLNQIFGNAIDKEIEYDNQISNRYSKNKSINSKYQIIEIHSQKEAYEYGQYSCSNSILCYTTHSDMWEKFTNKGANRVYLILDKNWKNIREIYGENNPYDEYGLSMIFLFINPEGNIAYSNTRWNHGTREHVNNVDHSFTKAQISELLNVNFNSIFKPYSEKALKDKGIITVSLAIKMLSQGFSPSEIFDKIKECGDGLLKVKLNDQYSFIGKNGKLIGNGKLWFNYVSQFKNGLARVSSNGKYSFIKTDGTLIGNNKLWFEYANDFANGFAAINLNGKWSFINTEGKLIGNNKLQFEDVSDFANGFAKVKLNGKWSFIDKNGNLINDGESWFDYVYFFYNRFAKVKLNGKCSFIDKNGKLIGNGNLWFECANDFANGFATIKLNGKWSFLDKNGNLINDGESWFDWVSDFSNGFARVLLNDKWSFIDAKGNLIGNGNLWFDSTSDFFDNFALIKLNGYLAYIDTEGNFYDYKTKQPIPSPIDNANENKYYIKKLIKETINSYLKNNLY